MAKGKKQTNGKSRLKSSSPLVPTDFLLKINNPRNIANLITLFLILVMFLTIPLLVLATVNQRDLNSSAKFTCERPASSTDNTAPSVAIENPSEGTYVVGNSYLIQVDAADNICVKSLELLIDGQLVKNFSDTPYVYTWDLRSVKAGNHVISARAIDDSGNITVTSASVFRSAKTLVTH